MAARILLRGREAAFSQLDRGGGAAAVGEDFLESMIAEAPVESEFFSPKNRGSHGAYDALYECGSGNT
jgi:hypothetical protein